MMPTNVSHNWHNNNYLSSNLNRNLLLLSISVFLYISIVYFYITFICLHLSYFQLMSRLFIVYRGSYFHLSMLQKISGCHSNQHKDQKTNKKDNNLSSLSHYYYYPFTKLYNHNKKTSLNQLNTRQC